MKRIFLFTLAALIVPIILLSGCAPSIPPRQEFTQEVPSLKQDMSRVYFFYGNWYTSWNMDLNKYGSGGTIYINGSNACLLNKKEYVALDLQPGKYEIYWQPNMTEFDLSKHKFKKTSFNFSPGETYYLAANMRDSGSMAAWFGAIGVLAADCLYVDTIDEEPLSSTSIRLVDYKVFNESEISPITNRKIVQETKSNNSQNIEENGSSNKSVDKVSNIENQSAENNNPDIYGKLEKLKKMYESQLITKEEYDSKRQKLVNDF